MIKKLSLFAGLVTLSLLAGCTVAPIMNYEGPGAYISPMVTLPQQDLFVPEVVIVERGVRHGHAYYSRHPEAYRRDRQLYPQRFEASHYQSNHYQPQQRSSHSFSNQPRPQYAPTVAPVRPHISTMPEARTHSRQPDSVRPAPMTGPRPSAVEVPSKEHSSKERHGHHGEQSNGIY